MPTPPYDDYPYYGHYKDDHASAPYVIVRSLTQLGLPGWAAALLNWLGRYDGLEQHLGDGLEPDPRFDPAVCVRDVLLNHVALWPALQTGQTLTPDQRRERIEAIIDDLLRLEFVGASALWCGQQRSVWNPLAEDFLRFIELGPNLTELRQMQEGQGLLDVWINPDVIEHNKAAIRRMLLCEEGA